MTVATRQEISILNRIFEDVNVSPEIIKADIDNYNGATAYFEILARNATGVAKAIYLRMSPNSDMSSGSNEKSLTIFSSDTKYTLKRSSSFTLSDVNIYKNILSVTSVFIKFAKIIILQSAGDITNTVTQIEIGQYGVLIPAAVNTWYAIPEPKYWKYEADKWELTPTFKFGFTLSIADDKESYIIGLQEASDAAFTTNLLYIAASQVTVTTEAVNYYESSNFTPKDGYFYRVVYQGDDAKDEICLYNAKVIVMQGESVSLVDSYIDGTSIQYLTPSTYGLGQSFTGDGNYLDSVVGDIDISELPVGLVEARIYEHSGIFGTSSIGTGSPLAVSDSLSLEFLSTGLVTFKFSGNNRIQFVNGTKYVVLFYSEDSTLDDKIGFFNSSSGTHDGNYCYLTATPSWGYVSAKDTNFWVYTLPYQKITKFQPEYLLINEAQEDSDLQDFMNDFDPDEWEGVDNEYFHEHSADSGSSNTKLKERSTLYNSFSTTTGPQIFGGTGTSEEAAGSFTTPNDGVSYIVKGVIASFQKLSSPTDNHQIRLTTTLGGTPIVTTNSVAASAITQGANVFFEFPSNQTLAPNTKYYLEIYRSGVRDSINYLALYKRNLDSISGAGNIAKHNGSWDSENDDDPNLTIYGWADIANSNITGDDLTRGGTALTMPSTAKEVDVCIVTA